MTDKVIKTALEHQLFSKECVVGVGLSGGADSVALTHILVKNKKQLNIKEIKAVHIHHGIRGEEADRDLEFSRNFCNALEIPFEEYRINVPEECEKTGESLEECARRLRYDIFEKISCDCFATAHNLNDNMETVIINLTRGTALKGLCGIPYKRGKYVRPILDCTREEIEQYIAESNLKYIVDSTNLGDDYTRNKIRHNVLPQLFEINSSFDKSFSKCLKALNEAELYIQAEAEKLFIQSKKENYFDCSVFSSSSVALKYQVISLILREKKAKNIIREHIESVDKIIKNGGSVCVGDNVIVTVEREKLYFGEREKTENFSLTVKKEGQTLNTPVGEVKIEILNRKDLQFLNKQDIDFLLDYDKISSNLFLRNRLEGDSFSPKNRKLTKTLKKLFNDEKTPVSKRSQMLILADDNEILWTEFFGVSEKAKVTKNTEKYIKITKTEG